MIALRALVAATLVVAAPTVVFRVDDPRIDEASGLAAGLRSPGVVYVQNDSGDTNRFFALNARTGATAATITVPGARNVDWEDLAVATDASGRASVWLADTGDNSAGRDEVRVYRVPEPAIDARADDESVTAGRAAVYRLRYPDGPVDTESLAVAPGGAAYLVTKSVVGASTVYRLPAEPDADRVQTLRRVADVRFTFTGTPGGPNGFGQLTATGASFSRDGGVLAVRTYTDAYLWRVRGGDVAAALRQRPTRLALPQQPQGEGIAVVGSDLLVDSEGVGQPVYSVPFTIAADAPSTAPATSAPPSSSASRAVPDAADRGSNDSWRYAVGAAVVIVLGLAVVAIYRSRARRG